LGAPLPFLEHNFFSSSNVFLTGHKIPSTFHGLFLVWPWFELLLLSRIEAPL